MSKHPCMSRAERFPGACIDLASPGIIVADRWFPPLAYTSYLPQTHLYRQIAACGIHLFSFPAYLAGRGINIHSGIGPFRKGLWLDDHHFDFTDLNEDMTKILTADPSARVIMRLHLDVPEWWERQHPDGCCRLHDGTLLRQSFTSPLWRQAAGEALRQIIAWFSASPYAPHLAGIHVAAGGTEEWVYHYRGQFEDVNPSRAAAFDTFLATRYPDQAARDNAWRESTTGDPAAALGTLSGSGEQRWRDPRRDAAARDACRFHSVALTEAIAVFCRIVKEASGGRLLTGVFYGYHFYIGDVRKGHTALSRLLDCPDLDYLASPNMYDRSPGTDWPPMVAVDSVRLHGKLWLAENDTRTALTRPLAASAPAICPAGQYRDGVWKGPESLELSASLLRANAARMLTHGYGGWWFDMWGGWFAHDDLLAELRALQEMWPQRERAEDPRQVPADTLCVIVDERLAEADASFGALCNPVFRNRYALAHCGRPYVIYLRSDLPQLDLGQAPFVWLLGFRDLSETEQMRLHAYTADSGGTVLHTDGETTRLLAAPCDDTANINLPLTLAAADLRTLLDQAGVHCWLQSHDVLYAGRGFVAIHAATAGEKCLCLPGGDGCLPLRPTQGEAPAATPCRFMMAAHETRIFRVVKQAP